MTDLLAKSGAESSSDDPPSPDDLLVAEAAPAPAETETGAAPEGDAGDALAVNAAEAFTDETAEATEPEADEVDAAKPAATTLEVAEPAEDEPLLLTEPRQEDIVTEAPAVSSGETAATALLGTGSGHTDTTAAFAAAPIISSGDAETGAGTTGAGEPPAQWAPATPPRKKRRGLWIGLGVGAVALVGAATAASLLLIAPGTTVAGVSVGWMTPGMATEAVENRIAGSQLTFSGTGGSAALTGAEIGAHVDAAALIDDVFASHPLWNLTAWSSAPVAAEVAIDPAVAEPALRRALPAAYTDPTDAGVVFDTATSSFVTTPAVTGERIDLDALAQDLSAGLVTGDPSVPLSSAPSPWKPAVADSSATTTAGEVNTMLGTLGLYVGEERTVPIDPATASSWFRVEPVDGVLAIVPDRAAIQAGIAGVPEAVNRAPVNARVVVNSSGEHLRELSPGQTGRTVGDLSGAGDDFAGLLADGQGMLPLPVTETPFETDAVHREISVNLSAQRLYMIENGEVIDSWSVSSGTTGWETTPGSFRIGWKTSSQNMGNPDLTKAPNYYQPDVKWVMYFNGDEALHGVYWHSNWGTPMSHGCVGMPEWRAQNLYEWSPQGLDVNVYY